MNFLLHHHLAARDLGSPAGAAGAMLPDLWRMADRRVRPAGAEQGREPHDAVLAAVLAGIEHHLAVDRWFHADPSFLEGERLAVVRVRAAGISARHIGLFAHVLWELCLDGEILRRQGLAVVIRDLRHGFGLIAEGAADRAAELHHFARTPRLPREREVFQIRMARLFEELARGPWIDGYQSGEGIAVRIQGVRAHLGLSQMPIEDHARLAGVAAELLARAPRAVDRILGAARGRLRNPGGAPAGR